MRKSFILHIDSLEILNDMSDEQSGKLFKAIFAYNSGKDYNLPADLKLLFTSFRNQFLRDSEKYNNRCEVNRNNGSKGGKQKVANATKRKRKLANLADNDNDSKNDSDNIKERKLEFINSINPYKNIYSSETLNDFYSYWTEPNKSGTKMRFELQKTWEIGRRLKTWSNNNKSFGKDIKPTSTILQGII